MALVDCTPTTTVEGKGCLGFAPPRRVCSDGTGDTDTATDDSEDTAWALEGGGGDLGRGSSCSTAPPSFTLAPFLLVLWLMLRRWPWAALLLAGSLASGAELENLQPIDGGRFTSLVEADLGAAWSTRAWTSAGWAYRPLTLRTGGGREASVDHLFSGDLGASLRIANWPRVLVGWSLRGVLGEDAGVAPGDLLVGLQLPLSSIEHRAGAFALHAHVDLPTSRQTWAGHPGALVLLAWQRPVGPVHLAANGGVRIQPRQPIRGVALGARAELGAAIGWRGGRLGLTAEVFGALPLTPVPWEAGQLPWELLGSVDVDTGRGHRLRVYGGIGLSRGDHDGCPEPDNDQDGIVDILDDCPNVPEIFNTWRDVDGCPDTLVSWTVRLQPEGRVETEVVSLSLAGRPPVDLLLGDTLTLEVSPGVHTVVAVGEGLEPLQRTLTVPEQEAHTSVVTVRQLQLGVLTVQLHSPGGPIAGKLLVDSDTREVPEEGVSWSIRRGTHELVASADGFATRTISVTVPRAGHAIVDVELEPIAVWAEGSRLVLTERVHFRLDEDTLLPEAVESLVALAAWLRNHPEVQLLRVEGFADGLGTSAYNLQLSRRRAARVQQELVHLGVAPERLEAIGSGEAHVHTGGRERRVGFTVLVWEDDLTAASGPFAR